jgi:hypothetical protein
MIHACITTLNPAEGVAFSDALLQSFVIRTLHIHIVAFVPAHIATHCHILSQLSRHSPSISMMLFIKALWVHCGAMRTCQQFVHIVALTILLAFSSYHPSRYIGHRLSIATPIGVHPGTLSP